MAPTSDLTPRNSSDKPTAVCVFCASSNRVSAEITEACRTVAAELARRGFPLIYGGTTCGLMKSVADAHKQAGGMVIGIVTRPMVEAGIGYPNLDEQVVVADLRERKMEMGRRAGAFLVLPGGIGTMDELFDTFGQKQLEYHDKPIILFNIGGYYDPLLAFLDHAVAHQTIRPEHLRLISVAGDTQTLLEYFGKSS